jgi:hypothetical protein
VDTLFTAVAGAMTGLTKTEFPPCRREV